ncbi:hypothetical protein NKH16_15065 [Mesorhizobium sp. M1307]|uniref:hypothetical protein n=1 Tax=Mesorhizobium sp. M1307 TaxID=2957079 RepID=UPI00333D837A
MPGAKHLVNTDSGHDIHKDQRQLVLDSIREVVDAVRTGRQAWSRSGLACPAPVSSLRWR